MVKTIQKTLAKNVSNNFRIYISDELRKASTRKYLKKLKSKFRESIPLFPELHPKSVCFGLCENNVAVANTAFFIYNQEYIFININPIYETHYYFLGHELTHFVQELGTIPDGEQQCDMWTMTRSKLFADLSPRYIDMPAKLRDYWFDYRSEVINLFDVAIETRKTDKRHIEWIERELFIKGREN